MKLKDLTSKIGSGATPRGGDKVYESSGITFIRSQNIYDFRFDENGLVYINNNQAKALNGVKVEKNDILLNITGDSIARACIVPEHIIPARVNQHVSIIRCKNKEEAYYSYHDITFGIRILKQKPKVNIMKTYTTNLFIGIDVHKKQWHVSIYAASIHHRTYSQPPEPEALKSYLDKNFPDAEVICAYEASKFGYWIYRRLIAYGYQCLVINPADIPTTNKETNNKTDRIDSRKIGATLRAGLLTSIHIPTEETEGDRHLFRYRKKVWGDLVRVKNRIKDKLLVCGIKIPQKYDNPYWTKGFLAWLKTVEFPSASTRLTLDFLLEEYDMLYRLFLKVSIEVRKIQRKAKYKKKAKLLREIPGIGPLTTVLILSEIEDVNRFVNFKKINAYVGFRPTTHSSGEKDRQGRMTYRRHNALRSALVESA